MGGYLFVGLRGSDGSEHLMKTHTNFWPWKCGEISFLQEGAAFQELVELSRRTKPPSGVVYPIIKQSTIRTVEYGVLLFDFKDRVVFSSNGYFSPGVESLQDITVDEAQWVLNLHEQNCLVGVYKGFDMTKSPYSKARDNDPCDPEALTELVETCKQVVTTSTPVYVDLTVVRFKLLDMQVTHSLGPNKDSAPLKEFLRTHDWQSHYGTRK